jgi:hypothetical protein
MIQKCNSSMYVLRWKYRIGQIQNASLQKIIRLLIIIDEGSGGDRELQGMICSNPSSGVVILGQSASAGQLMHGK